MSDIDNQMAEWRKTLWGTGPCQVSSQQNLTLTDEEREAVESAAGDYLYHQDAGGRAQWIRTTLLGLLERLG